MEQPVPHANHRVIALIVASALLMQNLDSAVVATALPSMAREMGEDPARLGAAITSYLVALTVFIPFSSWIADRFGAKRVFMLAIIVFVTASALSGQARGLEDLIAFRILQGAGGAMMFPIGRLLLLRGVRKEELLSAMAWLTRSCHRPTLGGHSDRSFRVARSILDQCANRAVWFSACGLENPCHSSKQSRQAGYSGPRAGGAGAGAWHVWAGNCRPGCSGGTLAGSRADGWRPNWHRRLSSLPPRAAPGN
jgi:hypothetical protein